MPSSKRTRALAGFCLFVALAPLALGQNLVPVAPTTNQVQPTPPAPPPQPTNPSARQLSFAIEVSGEQQWTETQIDLLAGDRVTFTGTGTLQYLNAAATGPEGLTRGWKDLLRVLPLPNLGRSALIGRIGPADSTELFSIGQQRQVQAISAGRLFLGVNQPSNEPGTGSFHVTLQIVPALPATKTTPAVSNVLSDLTAPALAELPRRVSDPAGNPG